MRVQAASEIPSFAEESPLLRGAYRFAMAAHHGPAREGDTEIDHPTRVACLLQECGFQEDVVAAGFLHDVVEDTRVEPDQIEQEFGSEIASLVREMTEDESIEPYQARKAEHRARIAADRRVAAIYAADKLANAKTFNEEQDNPDDEKLEHYCRTLDTLCSQQPDLPFLRALREELVRLIERRSRG